MAKKTRTEIPSGTAARVLFTSDRTCCVCRQRGKAVQIHHIDDDPANNEIGNLAILCFDCHRDTQIRGGVDRKLDADQVILYRDDWHSVVARARVQAEASQGARTDREQLELVTSVAEIYRENEQYELLAIHYDAIGNKELRDKYIELAIGSDASDQTICFLRGLQNRPDLIPFDVCDRAVENYAEHPDPLQRARLLKTLGRRREAVQDYLDGLAETMREGNVFAAAFYMKELSESGLVDAMFVEAYEKAAREGELWWQVRALQELGWESELRALLLANADEIATSGGLQLQLLLAEANGDGQKFMEIRKEFARNEYIGPVDEDHEPAGASDTLSPTEPASRRLHLSAREASGFSPG